MCKVCIPVDYCSSGDVLAEDVDNDKGVTLVLKNTVINSYIKSRLIELNIPNVWLYNAAELVGDSVGSKREELEDNYKSVVLRVKQLLNGISSGGRIKADDVEELSDLILNNVNESDLVIKFLAEVKNVDEYTYTHCVNVAFYSMLTAKWMGLGKQCLKEIIQAGLLHDIGKTKVPIDILNKNGKLTPKEFEIMKKHSIYGYEMIKDSPDFNEDIKKAVLQHHERIDGSGYPDELSGDDIGIYSRIISVADVFDAMTQDRVYKRKTTPFESFEMFLSIGISNFDTTVLSAFLKNIPVYYIGAKVLLNTGDTGEIVYVPPHNIAYPVINLRSGFIDLETEKDLKMVSLV